MGNADDASDDKATTSGRMARFFPAGLRAQYWDGALAICLLFMMQIIVFALSFVSIFLQGFSAAILGMMFLALTIGLMDWAVRRFRDSDAIDVFYHRYLRAPTDLLNKHMSVGFTVPFVQIFRSKPASALDIGLIIAMFALMGVLSPVLVYFMSYAIHMCSLRLGLGMNAKSKDFAVIQHSSYQRSTDLPQFSGLQNNNSSLVRFLLLPSSADSSQNIPANRFFDQSTLMGRSTPTFGTGLDRATQAEGGSNPGIQSQSTLVNQKQNNGQEFEQSKVDGRCCGAINWILHNICLFLCILSIPISIGLGAHTGITVFADTSFLLGTWMTTLTLQAMARSSQLLKTMPRRRTALVVCLNPVLVTSGIMIAYVQAKREILGSSVLTILDTFQSGLTFAGFLMDRTAHEAVFSHMTANVPFSVLASSRSRTKVAVDASAPCMGAGDVALTILESGLVAWGLKLFEYRRALVSHAGLVVLAASIIAAALTVVSGPLLAHAVGLARAQSIAFAARSVTLALGSPVMIKLGGDVGVNAAMVVFNGIVFQMAMGLGVVGWIIGTVEWCWAWITPTVPPRSGKAAQLDLELGNESSELTPSLNRLAQPLAECTDAAAGGGNTNISFTSPPRTSCAQLQQDSPYMVDGNCPGERLPCRQRNPSQASIASSSSAIMSETAAAIPLPTLRLGGERLPPSSPSQKPTCQPQASSTTVSTKNSVSAHQGPEDARTVAMGVTVGVNAAAMGTSYLYEQGSRAAPYSALAMTLFGVMTVIFTAIAPLTAWLVAQLGPAADAS